MDTTYFGRKYGIMTFRAYELRKDLYRKEVKRETKQAYLDGVKYLQAEGREILAIVCDGKKGLLGGFGDIPTQMCIFHQQQIIKRYITQKPKLEANIEFKEIASMIGKIKKKTLKIRIEDRYMRYKSFLDEKNSSKNRVHTRTRKAYRSLKTNLEYLYVFKEYEGKVEIPSTTNSLESVFGHMKQKVGLHRGLKKHRKLRLIDEFFGK